MSTLLPLSASKLPEQRPYQATTTTEVLRLLRSGESCRICVVSPTGSGKTRMGVELATQLGGHGLWLAHRTELIKQAGMRLREAGLDVGLLSPLFDPDPWSPIQVASLDTLSSRTDRPKADWVIFDECHHAPAATYAAVLDSYADTPRVGLTATPQRRDGKAMSGMFDSLVVAANYGELLKAGHIVPCRVFRPDEYMGSDLAKEPLQAYQELERAGFPRASTFAFAQTVELAAQYAAAFEAAGIGSAALTAKTKERDRAEILARFRLGAEQPTARGAIHVLWNVYVLTEGVDVPAARVCLLARGVSHAGPYLQMVGRVLRPFGGKPDAILVDLSGASHLHGFPTADRHYSLDGRPITVVGEALKNCPKCGATIPSAENPCGECGWMFAKQERRGPRIWDFELREAVEAVGGDPSAVSEEHKAREWSRLAGVCASRGWGISWAAKQYEELFGGRPAQLDAMAPAEKIAEFKRLRAHAEEKGFKKGWAAWKYKALFGNWPPRAWG